MHNLKEEAQPKEKMMFVLAILATGTVTSAQVLAQDNYGFDPNVTQFVDWQDRRIADAYSECAHNDGNSVGTYRPAEFDPGAVLKAIKAHDRARGCKYREYSNSRINAIARYSKFAAGDPDDGFSRYAKECIDHAIPSYRQEDMAEVLTDPTNLAVFASMFDFDNPADDNYSEGCAYYEFFIYRASGTVLRIVFNYTD